MTATTPTTALSKVIKGFMYLAIKSQLSGPHLAAESPPTGTQSFAVGLPAQLAHFTLISEHFGDGAVVVVWPAVVVGSGAPTWAYV